MSAPIKLNCDSGLCNRLAKLFSFLCRAREKSTGVKMRWAVNDHCNGRFLDVFDPVDGVEFSETLPRPYINGWKPHPRFDPKGMWIYGDLRLRDELQRKVSEINDWKLPTVAVHARRTDMIRLADNVKQDLTSSESMFAHIDTWFPDHRIFLATDNRATQYLFSKRYGQRLLLQGDIPDLKTRRRTSLGFAAVDLFSCIAATDFVGTHPSSFSVLISDFHRFLDHPSRLAAACGSFDCSANSTLPHKFRTVRGNFDFEDLYRDIADNIPEGGTFVEIGVLHGRSLCFMEEYLRHIGKRVRIVGVDAFRRVDFEKVRNFLPDSVELIRSDSAAGAVFFEDASVDAVFVDADHNTAAVKRDIESWLPKVRPDGLMAGHDLSAQFPGVKKALEMVGLPYSTVSQFCWIHDRRR